MKNIAVADVNGDGKPDLPVTACANSNCDGSAAVPLGIRKARRNQHGDGFR
jgi:hypothetical protein